MAFKLSSSQRRILMIALAVLSVIVGSVLIYFQATNLSNLREEVESEEIALNEATAVLNRRLEHKRNASVYQQKYDWLKLKIPDKPEEEEILRYFDYLSEEYDLIISNISFGGRGTNQEGGYIQMPLTIAVEGRYRNLVGFFDHLHRGDRAIRIDNITMTVASAETVQLRISLTANAFHKIEGQE